MTVEEFFYKIDNIVVSAYQERAFSNNDWEENIRLANEKLASESDFINEATADWTVEDWKNLFRCQINHGDPEIYGFVAEKIMDLTSGEFFRECIKENTELLMQDVYTSSDKDVLYRSDVLHGAVKALNCISSGTANSEVLAAFDACASTNEHILYDLAKYAAMHCSEKIPELILNESVDGDKLIALISMCVLYGKRSEEMF